jgi:hypothetical protein
MPYHSKAKSKVTKQTKKMKPVDTSSPDGEQQFKPTEENKKKLKKKDIFEVK